MQMALKNLLEKTISCLHHTYIFHDFFHLDILLCFKYPCFIHFFVNNLIINITFIIYNKCMFDSQKKNLKMHADANVTLNNCVIKYHILYCV